MLLLIVLLTSCGSPKPVANPKPVQVDDVGGNVDDDSNEVSLTKEEIKAIEIKKASITSKLSTHCLKQYTDTLKDKSLSIVKNAERQAECIQYAGKIGYKDAIPEGMEDFCLTLDKQEYVNFCKDALTKSSDYWIQKLEGVLGKDAGYP